MYGTIARIHPKPEAEAQLQSIAGTWPGDRPVPAGYVASYIFTPDENPYDRPTVFLVALFEDEPTYRANASSPEQDAMYREMRALLEDDPDWMDGTFTAM